MSKSLIIYFSRADENYAVGWIDKGNTEIVAEFVQELTDADMFKIEPAVPYAKDYQKGNQVPSVLFRPLTELLFYGIVVNISDIGSDCFRTDFWRIPIGTTE